MTFRYVVGGLAFTVDERLEELDTGGFADIEVRVRFVDAAAIESVAGPDGRTVSGPMGTSGLIAPANGECWLPILTGGTESRAWQVRQMAPIFGAVLGRLALHAGAVAMPKGVVGFIGESGVGKSTLVRSLADQGDTPVADDLLPVRFTPEASSPVGDRLSPLRALFLLDRRGPSEIRATRTEPTAALQGLIQQGFGEHGDPEAWAFQFDAYHRLADGVPVLTLTIPDDTDALPDVRDAVAALLDDGASPSPSDGSG